MDARYPFRDPVHDSVSMPFLRSDRMNRQFLAERPDQWWSADFTYVSTWQGFAQAVFIIDVFAGVIVGWRVLSSMETTFVLDALEQALWARRPTGTSITQIKVPGMCH